MRELNAGQLIQGLLAELAGLEPGIAFIARARWNGNFEFASDAFDFDFENRDEMVGIQGVVVHEIPLLVSDDRLQADGRHLGCSMVGLNNPMVARAAGGVLLPAATFRMQGLA